tara:strand:+ start:150 stop:527 length:378 start_codon:yes stop_codon:yes gene_type:complete
VEKGKMMRRQRQDAAEHLADKLFAAERALDEAIGKMADLIGHMPRARMAAHLSAVVGQDAVAEAAETLSAMIGARGHLVATHSRLADVRDQIGLKEIALGSGDMKPSLQAKKRAEQVVNLVDEAA